MRYNDIVYGQSEIDEPVILGLINSPWLTRLKNVNQGGYSVFFAKPDAVLIKTEHNRLAHSLGVYQLLKKFGAPIEEQIAGLIHDVSHSAFSHCIDYAIEGGNGKEQNHQDNLHESFVKKTNIPDILKQYGFDLNYILEDKNFPLKENNIPDICADRIDYALRDGIIFEEISADDLREILDGLSVYNNKYIFNSISPARKFARLYYRLNTDYYASSGIAAMYLIVGDYLKYALDKKYISFDDLYTTDKMVIDKINQCLNQDERIKLLWRRMNDRNSISQNAKNFDAEIFCKSRIVDPLFKDNGQINRLSGAEPDWKNVVQQELKPKQYFLKYNY